MNTTDIRILKNAGKELNDCSYRFINYCYIVSRVEDNEDGDDEKVTSSEVTIKNRKRLKSMKPEDGHKYLSIINSSLTGSLNEKFFPLPVKEDVQALFSSILQNPEDDSVLEGLYSFFADNLPFANSTNYLLTVADNTIDLAASDENGVRIDDASEECFSYIVVSVCPVNPSKPGLSFHEDDGDFLSRIIDWVAKEPLLAVTYPAFTKGEAEPENALLYVKNAKKPPEHIIEEIFGCKCPEAASSVTGKVQSIVQDAIEIDFGSGNETGDETQGLFNADEFTSLFDAEVKTMKKSIKAENDTFDGDDLERILLKAGAGTDAIKSARAAFSEEFSEGVIPTAKIMPIRKKKVKFEINTETPELVKTETVNGVLYMMIPISGGVSINGEIVNAPEDEESDADAFGSEAEVQEIEDETDEPEAVAGGDPEEEAEEEVTTSETEAVTDGPFS